MIGIDAMPSDTSTLPDIDKTAAAQIVSDGYAIVRNLLPEPDLDPVRQAAARALTAQRRYEAKVNAEDNFGSRRVRELLGNDETYWACAAHPVMLAIAERVLGPGFHIGAAALNEVSPGARAQRLHRDDEFVSLPRPFSRTFVMNSIWALTDFTTEAGATRFVTGSHRETRAMAEDEVIHAEMGRGSVFIFDGSLWHGSSRNNSTSEIRIGLVVTYCAAFVRPFENQLRGFSHKKLAAIPADRARLMSPALDAKIAAKR